MNHVVFLIRWSRQCWKVLTATFFRANSLNIIQKHHLCYTYMYVCNCLIHTFCFIHCYSIIQSPLLYYVIIYFQLWKVNGQCMEPSGSKSSNLGHFENVVLRPAKEARAKFTESSSKHLWRFFWDPFSWGFNQSFLAKKVPGEQWIPVKSCNLPVEILIRQRKAELKKTCFPT